MATQQIESRSPDKQARQSIGQRFGDFMMDYWATIVMIFFGGLVLSALSVPFLSFFWFDDV